MWNRETLLACKAYGVTVGPRMQRLFFNTIRSQVRSSGSPYQLYGDKAAGLANAPGVGAQI